MIARAVDSSPGTLRVIVPRSCFEMVSEALRRERLTVQAMFLCFSLPQTRTAAIERIALLEQIELVEIG